MRPRLTVLALLLLATACTPEPKTGGKFQGTIAEDGPLTAWKEGDMISVFDGTSGNSEYILAGGAGEKSGEFQPGQLADDGTSVQGRFGIYPYRESNICTTAGTIYIDLPSTQQASAGASGRSSAVLVARGSDSNLEFRQLCGSLAVRLSGSSTKVTSVTLSGRGGELLAGKATVSLDDAGVPAAKISSGSDKLKLILTSPVTLDGGTDFWFTLPPVAFKDGIKLKVDDGSGDSCEIEVPGEVSVERGAVKRIDAGTVRYSSPDKVSVGQPLPAWQSGWLDIHSINGGRGESFYYIFPDGTTMLVDAAGGRDTEIVGADGSGILSRPSQKYSSGNVIVRYLQHFAPEQAAGKIDYMMVSHYHADHMGAYTSGFTKYGWKVVDRNGTITAGINLDAGGFLLNGLPEVGMSCPIVKLIDRGEWDNRASNVWASAPGRRHNYHNFIDWSSRTHGTVREALAVGSTDQIVLKHSAAEYPGFKVRGIAAGGDIWTGSGTSVNTTYVPSAKACLDNIDTYDINENIFSCVFTLSYGKFDWFAGGDIQYNDYKTYSWKDIEKPISKVVGKVEAMKANHHSTSNTNSAALLGALKPDQFIIGVWTDNHPNANTLKRVFAANPGAQIYATNMADKIVSSLKSAGLDTDKFGATGGHIVLRVAPGGDSYYIFVLDDSDFEYRVSSIHGPFECK